MNECEHHPRALAAGKRNETDAHVASCARCQDTRAVAAALDLLARGTARLPAPELDARALFRRSQFAARLLGDQRLAERTTRPLAVARMLALAVLAGAIGWVLLGGVSFGSPGDTSTAIGLAQALTRLAAWPLAVGALAALATARFLWVED